MKHNSLKNSLFLCLAGLCLLAGPAAAEEISLSVGPEANYVTLQRGVGLGAMLGFEYRFNPLAAFDIRAGASFPVNNDPSLSETIGLTGENAQLYGPFIGIEGALALRFYFLRFKPLEIFASAGAGLLAINIGEDLELSRSTAEFEARLGLRLNLPKNWFLEPYVRGGYPFVWGAGLMAGLRFPLKLEKKEEPAPVPEVKEKEETPEKQEKLELSFTVRPYPFSPDYDGVDDEVTLCPVVTQAPGPIASWVVEIREPWAPRRTVKRFEGAGDPPEKIPWDGCGADGSLIIGGIDYPVVFSVRDDAGRSAAIDERIIALVKTPPPEKNAGPVLSLEISPNPFSPDNDGVDDVVTLFPRVTAAPRPLTSWAVEILEPWEPYYPFKRFAGTGAPPAQLQWDGYGDNGAWVMSAMDYPVAFSVWDESGQSAVVDGRVTAGNSVSVDLLTSREGASRRLYADSITFFGYRPDFIGLSRAEVSRNYQMLNRVAGLLNTRFAGFSRILVEGHTNPVLGTAKEEKNTLRPLSRARAKFIVEELVRRGVDRRRLSIMGMGSSRIIADPKDAENRWKNRRVEFVLSP